jgi:hypothetical protein
MEWEQLVPVPTCIQSSQIDDQISACYIKSKQTKPTNHSSEVCLFVFVCLFVGEGLPLLVFGLFLVLCEWFAINQSINRRTTKK